MPPSRGGTAQRSSQIQLTKESLVTLLIRLLVVLTVLDLKQGLIAVEAEILDDLAQVKGLRSLSVLILLEGFDLINRR